MKEFTSNVKNNFYVQLAAGLCLINLVISLLGLPEFDSDGFFWFLDVLRYFINCFVSVGFKFLFFYALSYLVKDKK